MPHPHENGRAWVARPDLYQPVTTDGAPARARGHIGDAPYVVRQALAVESCVALLSTGRGDAHALPTPDRR
jgi:hypothetical protein